MSIVKVKGESSVVKDQTNQAVLTTNSLALQNYKNARELRRKEKQQIKESFDDINTMKEEINDIKSMMQQILQKLG